MILNVVLFLLGASIGYFILFMINKQNTKAKKINKHPKRWNHEDPEDIFKQAESWWITNFLCEDQAKVYWTQKVEPGGSIPTGSYAVKFIVNASVCQAFSLELFFKCIQVIEKGSFKDGHYLGTLFKDLSVDSQNKIKAYYKEKITNSVNYKMALKTDMMKGQDMSFDAVLERSSKAYDKWRYIFSQPKDEKVELFITDVVYATKKLIEELKPNWVPIMPVNK